MGLSGWNEDKKLVLTIDGSKIEGDLTDFPINITLSSGTGQTNFDATKVFDELTASGTDRKKIAITDSNYNQLYVEIERWDWENKKAVLWTKVPTISSGTNNSLYLYYDATVSGNISYVGDTGETPAQNVWNSNFIGVWHLDDVDNILDSTSNTNDGFWAGYGTTNIALSKTTDQSSDDYEPDSHKAVDGDTGTYQMTNNSPNEWWKVDLGAEYTLGKIEIVKRSGLTERPKNYYIQTADDWAFTINVVNIITENDETNQSISFYVLNFGSVTTRYLRVYCHTTAQYMSIAEFRVYEAEIGDLIDGKIGKAFDFNGIDDTINCGTGDSLDNIGTITVESTFKAADWGESASGRVASKSNSVNEYGWNIFIADANDNFGFIQDWDTTDGIWYSSTSGIALDTWYHSVVQYDRSYGVGNKPIMYLNTVSQTVSTSQAPEGAIESDSAQNLSIGARNSADREFEGIIDEFRISSIYRPAAWIKATYYSNWNNLITFAETITFIFSNPIPIDSSTVYGRTQQLYLTTTITGEAPSYIYDAAFYNAYNDSQIGFTVSGTESGQFAGVIMNTPSGINYQWYMTATSSGLEDTSNTYTFINKFLCEGQTQVNNVPASGIPVRLYRRSTGEYIDGDISAGVSGTFEIETDYDEYHYAIALYNTTTANAVIQDWLIPQE